jgi:hypothetical protein
MNSKRAGLVGLVFVAIAFFYLGLTLALGGNPDYAGFTMLIALGAAMSLMAYVLFAGVSRS